MNLSVARVFKTQGWHKGGHLDFSHLIEFKKRKKKKKKKKKNSYGKTIQITKSPIIKNHKITKTKF